MNKFAVTFLNMIEHFWNVLSRNKLLLHFYHVYSINLSALVFRYEAEIYSYCITSLLLVVKVCQGDRGEDGDRRIHKNILRSKEICHN